MLLVNSIEVNKSVIIYACFQYEIGSGLRWRETSWWRLIIPLLLNYTMVSAGHQPINGNHEPVPSFSHSSCLLPAAFQTEGKLYLILDFLRGGDLFTRLSKEVNSEWLPQA